MPNCQKKSNSNLRIKTKTQRETEIIQQHSKNHNKPTNHKSLHSIGDQYH